MECRGGKEQDEKREEEMGGKGSQAGNGVAEAQ
jgi:hypothetical protein